MRNSPCSPLDAALAAGTLALGAAASYNGYVVRRTPLKAPRLPAGTHLRLVVLSDLHGETAGWRRHWLARLVRDQSPHLILLAGDIFDDVRPFENTEDFLRQLNGCAPLYYALGNHEFRSRRVPEICRRAQGLGVRMLRDGWVTLGGGRVALAGMDDYASPAFGSPERWLAHCRERFAPLKDFPGLRILISHRPELQEAYGLLPFDLVVCGHAHGGQARIPGLCNGVYAVQQGLFPPWVGGLYRHGSWDQLVSRGVSRYLLLPRVFNPPEVSLLELEGTGTPHMDL